MDTISGRLKSESKSPSAREGRATLAASLRCFVCPDSGVTRYTFPRYLNNTAVSLSPT